MIETVDNKVDNEGLSLFNQMSQLPESVLKVRDSKKSSQEEMEKAICDLCRNRWVTSVELSTVLDREKRTLLRILRPMVLHHVLKAKEKQINHPQQAYQTAEEEQ